MPLVFAANQKSKNEQNYRDVIDTEYEFPTTYRRRVRQGETFIYYRGQQGPGPHGYFGVGIVGSVRPSDTPGRLFCDVLDVQFFDRAVPLRDPANDAYLEDVGLNRVNMRQGIRLISDERAARILELAETPLPETEVLPPRVIPTPTNGPTGRSGYASNQQLIDAIFRYSTDVVVRLLSDELPNASIEEMPHNNPGFDLLVDGGNRRYVEVKGTMLPEIAFFLSEGERAYSESHADDFVLYVVYDIDLEAKSHRLATFYGAIDRSVFQLDAVRYRVLARADPGV